MKKRIQTNQTELSFDAWRERISNQSPMMLETDEDDIQMMYDDYLKVQKMKTKNTMSNQMMTGYICLSDIPKDKVSVSEKNGKKYLNVVLWINDAPDKYGNSAAIQVGLTKEERAAKVKPTYIGNMKLNQQKDSEGLPF
jgi:hypothetical protein